MEEDPSSSHSFSSSSPSGSSSDSSSLNSVSSLSKTTPHSSTDLKDDEIKVKLDPYPKVEGNSCKNENNYKVWSMVSSCLIIMNCM